MGGLNTPLQASSAIEYLDDEVRYPRYFNTLNHDSFAHRLQSNLALLLRGCCHVRDTFLS